LDLFFGKPFSPHPRHDVLQYVTVTVAAVPDEPVLRADIVSDHDSVAARFGLDDSPDEVQSLGIARHIDV
jgi:hypothetical protein